jgi:hypothetical protein
MFLNLRLKLLWLWIGYPIRWAHKPLCQRYEKDVMRLGKMYFCRSCFCAYLGVVTMLGAVLVWGGEDASLYKMLLMWSGGIVLPLSAPGIYKRLPRAVRDGLRFIIGGLPVLAIYLIVKGAALVGLVSLSVLWVFWRVYFKQRKRRKRHECDNCPELKDGAVCPGFERQARYARIYESRASALVVKSGFRPKSLLGN